jgi:hypothetical protein
MKTIFVALAFAGAAVAVPAQADVLFDQISADYTDAASYVWDSTQFDSANSAYDIALLDDFTIGANYNLTSIDAAVSGFDGFNSMAGITGYRVEIYSSTAAAANSLTGDVASVTLGANDVTTTSPFSMTWSPSGLVHIPVDISLAAGSYYLAVMAINDFTTNGEAGILMDTTKSGNAIQANPNGGFGMNGNLHATNPAAQASYRINGDLAASPAPEPATWGMMVMGFGLAGAAVRRRKTVLARA